MSKTVEVARTAHRVIADYMGTKPGEKVVIVVDTRTSPSIPEMLAAAAHSIGADPVIVMMTPRAKSGMEPPEPVTAAMVKADVVIAAASRSMYHIEAKNLAKLAGARGVFNAPFEEDGWMNGAMTADFLELRKLAERLRDRLARGKRAHVTSPAGTDVQMVIEGRKPVGWLTGVCRNRGEVSAFPGGEVSLPPLEGTTEGRVVMGDQGFDLITRTNFARGRVKIAAVLNVNSHRANIGGWRHRNRYMAGVVRDASAQTKRPNRRAVRSLSDLGLGTSHFGHHPAG